MRADSGRDRAELVLERVAGDLGERAGHLDAGRPAADDDEGEQAPLRRDVAPSARPARRPSAPAAGR